MSVKLVVPSCNNVQISHPVIGGIYFSLSNTNAGEEITSHHFGDDIFMSKLVSLSKFSKGRSAVLNPK